MGNRQRAYYSIMPESINTDARPADNADTRDWLDDCSVSIAVLGYQFYKYIPRGPKKSQIFVHIFAIYRPIFKKIFAGTFCGKYTINRLLNIPPHLRCVATLPCCLITNFPQNVPVKKVWITVNIWRSYDKSLRLTFLAHHVYKLSDLAIETSGQR